MGFHVEINAILRTDEAYSLSRLSEHDFSKDGSRVFMDDIPIWLAKTDWTALAEISIIRQERTPQEVTGRFRVLHVYQGSEQQSMTTTFRRMFANNEDSLIYLLMAPADFEKAQTEGVWDPPSRQTDGFIHCSPADQLTRVANKYHSTNAEVRVVALQKVKLTSEVRWEPATGGLYPHVYGPINFDAVQYVDSFRKPKDGTFTITIRPTSVA